MIDQIQRPLYLGLEVGLDADEATREHLLIVDAVRQRDARSARKLMREQITASTQRILAALTRHSAAEDALATQKDD